MGVEVSGGLVDKFKGFKKKLADKQKPKIRSPKKSTTEVKTGANSDEYRSGWDRIFGRGKSAGDAVQEQDPPEDRGAAADLRGEDPAASDPG